MSHDLRQDKVAPPIRKAIADYLRGKVHARLMAENVDCSDLVRVEHILRDEAAHFNAETASDFRVVLHDSTESEHGFAAVFEVVRRSYTNH
jgi:hypothetical protein